MMITSQQHMNRQRVVPILKNNAKAACYAQISLNFCVHHVLIIQWKLWHWQQRWAYILASIGPVDDNGMGSGSGSIQEVLGAGLG